MILVRAIYSGWTPQTRDSGTQPLPTTLPETLSSLPGNVTASVTDAHGGAITDGVFSNISGLLATASEDKLIKLWSLQGVSTGMLRGHTGSVLCVDFDTTGELLVSGSVDTTLGLWNLKTARRLHVMRNHTDKVLAVMMSPDSSSIVSVFACLLGCLVG
jgi:WD40 repeat protein